MNVWSPPIAVVAVLAASVPAPAQEVSPTILEGFVVDGATGQPMPNVLLRFEGGGEVLSDERGRYRIEGLEAGDTRILLVTSRCNVTWGLVTLRPGEIRQVAFAVPSEVEAPEDPNEAELRWKRRSQGTFLTAAEIEDMRAPNLAEVVRRVAPNMVGAPAAQAGGVTQVRSRSNVSFTGPVEPIVVVDGSPVAEGSATLSHMRPYEAESIEILKGASAGWEYGTGGSGGVIRVVTKRGEEGHWRADPHRCEIPPFPPRRQEAGGAVRF